MRIGKMRHRLAFQSATTTRSESGQSISVYSTYITVWGSIDPLRGKETESAQQGEGEQTHIIKVRYHSSIVVTDRITNGGRTFEINAIQNIQDIDRELHIRAKEIL